MNSWPAQRPCSPLSNGCMRGQGGIKQPDAMLSWCCSGCAALEVLADVVAVTLHLSSEELCCSFSLDILG